jgi:hypothetical protein
MEPGQDTGKSDATQRGPDDTGPPHAQRPAPDAERGGVPRSLVWGMVAVAVVAGLALYFAFERNIAPLFGGGH